MATKTKKQTGDQAAKAEAAALTTVVKGKRRPPRSFLPGNFLVSKTGRTAYIVLTGTRSRQTDDPLVRLRFADGTLSSGSFTIPELKQSGAKFLKTRPKSFPASAASDTDPRAKDKAKARRTAKKDATPKTPKVTPQILTAVAGATPLGLPAKKKAKAKAGGNGRAPSARLAGLPPTGTEITATYKKKTYKAKIVEGGIQYAGTVYASLSAAGCAVTGRPTCNGWSFFNLRGKKKTDEAPAKPAPKATPARASKVKAGRISKKKK